MGEGNGRMELEVIADGPAPAELPGRGVGFRLVRARRILTRQRSGFLCSGPHPLTHTLSGYVGCQYGGTFCGRGYCYARFLPNWQFAHGRATWGSAVDMKENAPELLDGELRVLGGRRSRLRVFCSPATDPYMPAERRYRVTRRCLEVFARYPDLDLLTIQTRAPLVEGDFGLLREIPYAWLSMTIETDDEAFVRRHGGGPLIAERFRVVRKAAALGIPTQVALSPCVPHSDAFAAQLLETGSRRFIVDTVVDGDGAGGRRTA
jgi:DNA repair photolyase